MSYAFHGRPPESDCKPPPAADFVPYCPANMSAKGTVDKFIGDAVMGDVERRRRIPITSGLHVGNIVVGNIGSADRNELHCARRHGEIWRHGLRH
jgi:hypothetical protein